MKHLLGISDTLKQNGCYLRNWLVTFKFFLRTPKSAMDTEDFPKHAQTIFWLLLNQNQNNSLWTHMEWIYLKIIRIDWYPNSNHIFFYILSG